MSPGFGCCRKVAEDNACAIYRYYAYDFEFPASTRNDGIFDGTIPIAKSCLDGLEIRESIPKRRRRRVKKALAPIPLDDFIKSGEVLIHQSIFNS